MTQTMFDEWLRGLTLDYWATGQHKIAPQDFMEKWAQGEAVLLDVRDEIETEFISFPFALHISLRELPDRLDEIPRDKLIATFCPNGGRANVAFTYLHARGFDNVRMILGGYAALIQALTPGAVLQLKQT